MPATEVVAQGGADGAPVFDGDADPFVVGRIGYDKSGAESEYGVFSLSFPASWLAANPLSASALADEAAIWQRVGFGWTIKRRSAARGRT